MTDFFLAIIVTQRFVMVEPRLVPDLTRGSVLVGQRLASGLTRGSALVGGQIVICLVRLYGSPTVVVWSKGMYGGRAKTARGAGEVSRKTVLGSVVVGRLRQVRQVLLVVEQRSASVV